MSIKHIRAEIARFLASEQPEVLCLTGKWGVGKTFSWNAFIREAKNKNGIALKSYSYVSMFGIDSVDQLKYSIFENAQPKENIGIEPSLDTLRSNIVAVSKKLGRGSMSAIFNLALGKDRTAVLQSVSFLSVRETIICIDDLERKGTTLSMRDVLGLVAHLKEKKACKVLLITNDDELPVGDDREQFSLYNEKVIDASIRFSPNAADCVEIAIQGSTPAYDLLRETVVSLNISNIRIIKKIQRLVERIAPLLEGIHPNVLRQAVQSLTLLGWSVHSKNEAPDIDFLRHKRTKDFFGISERADITEDEKKWNALLDSLGFTTMDEFDISLLEGIEQGYFDDDKLVRLARQLEENFQAAEHEGSLRESWRLYHDSFDDNEEEVVKGILTAFRLHVRLVTPLNLNGTVKLLKDLGRAEEARQALDYYMSKRGNECRSFFNLDVYGFDDEIDDRDVRGAFDDKYRAFRDERSPAQVLVAISQNRGWSRDDITLLSNLSVDDFYKLFKEQNGEDHNRVIIASLQFERTGGTGDEEKSISAKAREALVRIGSESAINRRRVAKFGIDLEQGPAEISPTDPGAPA